jgi:hypothetical protein
MNFIYQYLVFEKQESTGKTDKFLCRNKKSTTILGEVKWHGSWRQYCYFPLIQAVYSAGCLTDIADFLNQLNKKP